MTGYITILLAALALLLGGTGAYIFKSDVDKVRLEQAITAQKSADNTSCNADKKITEDADAKIQSDNAALNKRINTLLLQPARCVPVIAKRTGGATAKGQQGQASGDAGINSGWLIQYAGECEEDRLQLNDLIDFVDAVWARKQTH